MPRLSVLIPSLNGFHYLGPCITALRNQTIRPDEVIVVDCTPDLAARQIPSFDGLRIEILSEPVGVPQMRSIGFKIATGDLIAMTEDHCVPSRDWCAMIRKSHDENPEEVIGGAVENGAVQTLVDWSSYFCEYVDFMLPLKNAPSGPVPGNNVAYKRSVVERHLPLFAAGLWEFFIHAELAKSGVKFRMDPRIRVLHWKNFTAQDFQSQSFHFARSFAAMRAMRASQVQLLKYRFLSPVLPAVVMARLIKKVMAEKKRCRREFLLSLPWTFWFQLCWCAGEISGYWMGEGNSTQKIK